MDQTHYILFDIESIPDGDLLRGVQYAGEPITPDEAVDKARAEALEKSDGSSDFIPYSFQLPIGLCVMRLAKDYRILNIACLDAPLYRPREIVRLFWESVPKFTNAKLVTFNGKRFDIPLLELCAFRYGFNCENHFSNRRDRWKSPDIDLYDVLTNNRSTFITGGLGLLAKMIGKPGKMGFSGDKVLDAYRAGHLREINDYCMCDVLDTYFVFLRLQVVRGYLKPEHEADLNRQAREYLEGKADAYPVFKDYLSRWTP
jgi:3'-5' exonuclease